MAIDRQQHIFNKGLNKDIDPRVISNDQITDALNAEMVSDEIGNLLSVEPMKASSIMGTIPTLTSVSQVERMVCEFGSFKVYSFNFRFSATNSFSFAVVATTYGQFRTRLSAALTQRGYTATINNPSGNIVTLSISFGSVFQEFDVTLKINEVVSRTDTIVDNFSSNYQVKPLQTAEIQDKLFVLSDIVNTANNASYGVELGVFTGGVSSATYTRLLRTNKLRLNQNEVIDMHVSLIFGGVYSINYAYKGERPRVIYAPSALTQDCCVTYANPLIKGEGNINLNSVDIQTSLQLTNNVGRISFTTQDQIGGSLKSGGYRYFVRFGLNITGNVTEWSLGSGNVPVYIGANNKSNSWVLVQGNISGEKTSKKNNLLIEGINPNAFDFIEVAAVQYSGTSGSDAVATEAYIIGRKNVTTDKATFTHIGGETTTQDYTIGELLQVEDVYISAKSQEIKKNRLNLASVEVAVTDNTYKSFVEGISILPNRFEIGNQGTIGSSESNTQVVGFIDREGDLPFYNSETTTNIAGQYNPSNRTFTASSSGTFAVNFSVNWTIYPNGGGLFPDEDVNTFCNIQSTTGTLFTYDQEVQAFDNRNNFNSVQSSVTVTLNAGQTIVFDVGIYNFSSTRGGISKIDFSITTIAGQQIQSFNNTKVGGYMLPENCANKVGYMLNEVYYFYARLHLKNGYITDPIFIGNKQILDTFATNIDNYDQPIYQDWTKNIWNYNFRIPTLNVDAIRNSVKGISIWRGDSPKNILSTGMYSLADYKAGDLLTAGFYPSLPVDGGANRTCYFQVSDFSNDLRRFGFFNSPEVSLEKEALPTALKLRCFGSLSPYNYAQYRNGVLYGNLVEYRSNKMQSSLTFNVENSEYIPFNKRSKTFLNSGNLYREMSAAFDDNAGGQAESLAISTNDRVFDANEVTKQGSTGAYLTQLWAKDMSSPTVLSNDDVYNYNLIYTGTFIEINSDTPSALNNILIYGGDTYTVKAIQKQAYSSQRLSAIGIPNSFLSSAITYYTQSRTNTDLNYNDSKGEYTTQTLKGFGNIVTYLQPFTTLGTPLFQEQFNNDGAYNAENKINYPRAYDPNIKQASKLLSRIVYSEQRTEQGFYDFYRKILPLSFKDLDAKYGEIVGLKDVMDKMVALQEDAISVMPYQTNVSTNADSTQVYIGTGGVYEQQQEIVATYGCKVKSGLLVSKNNNGNNMLYWFDSVNRNFCRYSWDGVKVLSVDNGMRTYFLNWSGVNNNYDILLGSNYNKGSVYISNRLINETIVWNEKMNCFTTETSFYPIRYFNYDIATICPNITSLWGRLYNMFPKNGTNTLSWFDGAQVGDFEIEVSTNKGGVPKAFQSVAILVGDNHNTSFNPSVTVTTEAQSSVIQPTEWDFRTGTIYATVRNDNNDNRIISNFAKFKVILNNAISPSATIRILNIVNNFRAKYPNPFNFK